MNPRGPTKVRETEQDGAPMTQAMRRDMAARALLNAIDTYVGVLIATQKSNEDWVDQRSSPLGKRAHMEAVRRGDLRGVKHGRRILVRRTDLNSFLENHSVKHRTATDDSHRGIDTARASEVAAAVLTRAGLRQRKG